MYCLRQAERTPGPGPGSCSVTLLAAPAGAANTLELGTKGVEIDVPEGWSFARHANIHKIYNIPIESQTGLTARSLRRTVSVTVSSDLLADHAAAVQGLRVIAAESGAKVELVTIAGWPGLQRRFLAPRPQSGLSSDESKVWMVTSAVAIDNLLLRLEAGRPRRGSARCSPASRRWARIENFGLLNPMPSSGSCVS